MRSAGAFPRLLGAVLVGAPAALAILLLVGALSLPNFLRGAGATVAAVVLAAAAGAFVDAARAWRKLDAPKPAEPPKAEALSSDVVYLLRTREPIAPHSWLAVRRDGVFLVFPPATQTSPTESVQ